MKAQIAIRCIGTFLKNRKAGLLQIRKGDPTPPSHQAKSRHTRDWTHIYDSSD